MKRLCVFYYKAFAYLGKPIDWIICKECQRKLAKGTPLEVALKAPAPEPLPYHAVYPLR